jgi:hypothetical protein
MATHRISSLEVARAWYAGPECEEIKPSPFEVSEDAYAIICPEYSSEDPPD